MRARDPDDALARCSALAVDWSGGTRIGEALARFNRDWSRRVLGQGAITLLITDGLERDSLDRLEAEMERLAKSSRRVIWVNPLLRFGEFAAKAGGIRTMLPYVDSFRPIHNLASMADLCRALSGPEGSFGDRKDRLSGGRVSAAALRSGLGGAIFGLNSPTARWAESERQTGGSQGG